jgi:hypothetical protein
VSRIRRLLLELLDGGRASRVLPGLVRDRPPVTITSPEHGIRGHEHDRRPLDQRQGVRTMPRWDCSLSLTSFAGPGLACSHDSVAITKLVYPRQPLSYEGCSQRIRQV